MPAVDPRVLRFLARHAVGPREAVERDVAPWRGVSAEETWPTLHALGRTAATMVALQPDAQRVALLLERDPPPPVVRLRDPPPPRCPPRGTAAPVIGGGDPIGVGLALTDLLEDAGFPSALRSPSECGVSQGP